MIGSSREFLHRYEEQGEEFLDSIVTRKYNIFLGLKKRLGGMHLASNEEVTVVVNEFLRAAAGEWYDEGLKKLAWHDSKSASSETMLKNKGRIRLFGSIICFENKCQLL